MAKILTYTSPARGHLFPIVPTLRELVQRGHEVMVCTLDAEVLRMRAAGLAARPIAREVEAIEMTDYRATSPIAALTAACETFIERGRHEIVDLRRVVESEQPDFLYVDVNSWGASAAAQMFGLPWAAFAPYFMPIRGAEVPAYGMGLPPPRGVLGRLRDAVLWPIVERLYDRALPALNRMRSVAGAPAFRRVAEFATAAPTLVSYTAEPFEYARSWPSSYRLVGPGLWEPPSEVPAVLAQTERPLVLVTCSTEFQNDARIIEQALAGLAHEPFQVVATTASVDPAQFDVPANAYVTSFLPHTPLLGRAACVICHGGMGITQKALAAGVPVCVVPFGRDQLEVARHVEVAGAGVRLMPNKASAERMRGAVTAAMGKKDGALRIAEAFRRAGGAAAAADAIEESLPQRLVRAAHQPGCAPA